MEFGVITISTTISRGLWDKAKAKKICWAEALRIGVTSLLATNGDDEYLNPLQAQRKIEKLAITIQEVIDEKNRISAELDKIRRDTQC